MYTQCSHCRAVFRVTMKELTAAQGLLRCGECDTIFDAMKALSTTLPEERNFPASSQQQNATTPSSSAPPSSKAEKSLTDKHNAQANNTNSKNAKHNKTGSKSRKLLYASLITLLVLVLLAQIPYAACGWLSTYPMVNRLTGSMCQAIGYKTKSPRNLEKIKMLSHNVYSHPNSPNVLIISTSIQNDADFEQPYPLLEVSFLNETSEVVALRRFMPSEYLSKNMADTPMPTGQPREFSLNIADPGKDAIKFQFRFL